MKDYSNYYPSINDRVSNDAVLLFREKLNTLDGYDVMIDGVSEKVIIHNHTNPLDEYKEDRKLLCLNEVIVHRGSIVLLEGDTYLVITDIDNGMAFKTCKIRKINYTLTYKSPLDPTQTIQTPCVSQNATLYSLGIQETKIMSVPDGKLSIILPNNEQTHAITRGMRFLYHGFPYKVTFIDMSTVGLIGLVLSEDVLRDEDDLINQIAWNDFNNTPIEPSPTGTLIIDGSDFVVINRTQIYEVKMDDGTVHSGNYRFDLSDNALAVITEVTSMTCVIKGLMKGVVTLTATNLVSGQQISKDITVKSLL